MALQTNELYSENSRAALLRIQPAEGPGSVVVKAFASGSGTLPIGCPVYVNTSGTWAKLAPAGTAHASAPAAEIVTGIVVGKDVVLNAGGEVLGTVMLRGSAHLVDIAAAHGTAANNANFLTALRNPKTRLAGISIDGLTLAQ
jgi:hypothetical protein